jgi:hypothetical protein
MRYEELFKLLTAASNASRMANVLEVHRSRSVALGESIRASHVPLVRLRGTTASSVGGIE